MKTNTDTVDKQEYKSVIFSGCAIESNGISICNLNDHINRPSIRGANYQVWSDRYRVYEMYHNLDDAVDKFLELKNRSC